jgi:hypothetical protein
MSISIVGIDVLVSSRLDVRGNREKTSGAVATTGLATLWLSTVAPLESESGRSEIPTSNCPFSRIMLRTLSVASNELQYTIREEK